MDFCGSVLNAEHPLVDFKKIVRYAGCFGWCWDKDWKKKKPNEPERQLAAVACSAFQCDSAETQGGLLGLSCLPQHRPCLADLWRYFSAMKPSHVRLLIYISKINTVLNIRGKRKVTVWKERSEEHTFTFRNDQMSLMSHGNSCQTLPLSRCKHFFNSCSALPWDVEMFSREDGSVGETVSDGATQTKVWIWRTVLY